MEGMMRDLVEYARKFIGTPYLWGGKCHLEGFDCSGFIQEVLNRVGIDPVGDQSSQAYFNFFSKNGTVSEPKAGALVFYGKSTTSITHISFCTNEHIVVEAAGGDATTLNKARAAQQRAFVKERLLSRRKDVVAIIMPIYPEWVKGPL